MDAIETVHKCSLAKEIIAFFAFLGQAPIPLDLVKEWFKTIHPETEELDLDEALMHLCGYSMIDSPSFDFYQVHSLVQQVIQYRMANPQQVFEHAFNTLYLQMKKSKREKGNTWNLTKSIIPHALPVLKRQDLMANVSLDKQHEFMFHLGELYQTHGNYYQALKLWQDSLKAARQWCDHDRKLEAWNAIALSYNNMGVSSALLGKFKKALKCYRKTLEIWLILYGKEHLNVARIYNNIGLTLKNLGRFEEASIFQNKFLKIWVKAAKEKQPGRAMNPHIVVISYDLGKFDGDLDFHQRILKLQVKLYGEVHSDVAIGYNMIGWSSWDSGEYEKALECEQKTLNILIKLHGKEHPYVATSYHNVGLILQSLEKYEEALNYHQYALRIQLKIYRTKHPDIAASYYNIGSSLENLEKYEKALKNYQKAVTNYEKIYPARHPKLIKARQNITTVLNKMNERQQEFENQSSLKNDRQEES